MNKIAVIALTTLLFTTQKAYCFKGLIKRTLPKQVSDAELAETAEKRETVRKNYVATREENSRSNYFNQNYFSPFPSSQLQTRISYNELHKKLNEVTPPEQQNAFDNLETSRQKQARDFFGTCADECAKPCACLGICGLFGAGLTAAIEGPETITFSTAVKAAIGLCTVFALPCYNGYLSGACYTSQLLAPTPQGNMTE